MKPREIHYKKTDKDTGEVIEGSVTFNEPESVEEAISMWGEDVCLSNLMASVVISVQRIARAADSPEAAQEAVSKFVPGVSRRTGGPTKSALLKELKGINESELAALIDMIRAKKASDTQAETAA